MIATAMPVGILSRVDSPAGAGQGEAVARTLARPDEATALARAATAHSARGCDPRGPRGGSTEQPRIRLHDELRTSP